MKVAVLGSRTFNDKELLYNTLDALNANLTIELVISGGARGADRLAEQYAKDRNITIKIYPADWTRHGRGAGFIRNKDIVKNSDYIVAFWDGLSSGTKNSLTLAKQFHKPFQVVRFKNKLLIKL